MDKPVKEVKSKGEIIRLFNTKVVKSEKVVIGGKTMYMTIDKIDDSGKGNESNFKFPDNIDYQKPGDIPLHKNIIKLPEDSEEMGREVAEEIEKVNKSVNAMITLLVRKGFKNPVEEFTTLDKVERYLQKKISSFSKIEDISDKKLRDIFHTIQVWGGNQGMRIYVKRGGFDENFDIEIYRKFVERCLNFEKDGDWVETVSKWTFESHMFGFNISFSTKHVRFWLFKKLKENSLPIYDQVIRGKKDNYNKRWISGLNKYNPEDPLKDKEIDLTRYWKQMIEKSEKEKITLERLERILFNYFIIRSENHKTTTKVLEEVISGSSKSEIKKFPRGKNHKKATKLEKEQYKHFNYLVDEIVLYINKYLVKEKCFNPVKTDEALVEKEEYELFKDEIEKLIEFAFQGRNEPKYPGRMEELFKGFKR